MIFPITIIGLIFTAVIISSNYSQPQPQQHTAVIISSNYSQPQPQQHITFKQGVEKEQQYINSKSYYLSQGCNPETIDSTGHVINWRCPAGTESVEERLFTGNKTANEICYEPKYNKTKAYTELCSDKARQSLQQEQEYINQKSYYLSQGCKPQTIDNTHHVLTWNCPPGTETIQERLFTANKSIDEICYEPKYNKTKAYTEMCT